MERNGYAGVVCHWALWCGSHGLGDKADVVVRFALLPSLSYGETAVALRTVGEMPVSCQPWIRRGIGAGTHALYKTGLWSWDWVGVRWRMLPRRVPRATERACVGEEVGMAEVNAVVC